MTDPDVLVGTRNGTVRGAERDGLLLWRGIPYAAPPVGRLRFRPPTAPTDWAGIRDAARLPAIPWQSPPPPGMPPSPDGAPQPPIDEDCLFVSVTRPAGPVPARGLPVLVWIHGGGSVSGSAPLDSDGAAIAGHGVLVVSVAYRLGAFGFLHLQDLLGTDYAGSGGVGLLEQLQALRWVHDNIAAFGGDPARVTLYGISAGAKSVANLLSMRHARNLLHRAICGSGCGEHVATVPQAVQVRQRLLDACGLTSSVERLTSMPAADLLAAQEALGTGGRVTWLWRPVIDGVVLREPPIAAIESVAAAGIPLLLGHNGREGATFAAGRSRTARRWRPATAPLPARHRAERGMRGCGLAHGGR